MQLAFGPVQRALRNRRGPGYYPPDSGFIEPRKGMAMRMPDYQVTGEGKTTIFLLHGIYGAKDYWRYVTERLVARGCRVVAWDAPGYGLSPLPDQFSFDVVAEAGARLIKAQATETNVVFGHSMGGQITPRIRLKVPELVHGIVISATIGYFGNRTKEEQEEF